VRFYIFKLVFDRFNACTQRETYFILLNEIYILVCDIIIKILVRKELRNGKAKLTIFASIKFFNRVLKRKIVTNKSRIEETDGI
jgi:hypothetical protein